MRLKSRAEKQAERCKQSPAKYDRKFARKEWRKSCGDMFFLRGLMNSLPTFRRYVRNA